MTRGRLVGALAGGVAVCVLAILQLPMQRSWGGLIDYWPLYYGASAWLETGDAYWQDPSLPSTGAISQVGNAYPLHAALAFGLPLVWASPPIAGMLWVLLVGLAWVGAIAWARESWYWLAWFPMWDALRIQQLSAAIAVATIVALGSIRRDARWPFIAALFVLSMKPQQTIVLLLVMAWWGRHWWREIAGVATVVLGLTFVAQPGWVGSWIDQVMRRDEVVAGAIWWTLLVVPAGIWMVRRGWRVPGLAVVSSGAGPWPPLGYYMASAYPTGADREQAAAMALIGLVGYAAAAALGWRAFVVVMAMGLTLAAWRMPRPRVPLAEPPAPVIRKR